MPPLKSVPGMRDLLPHALPTWRRLRGLAEDVAELRGYAPIETPILEPTELFSRAVGEGTDVVDKEMYTFTDAGGRSVTLRPEATASVTRAYFDAGLHQQPQPVRLYYWGPTFRYDRPQAGRYRQFFQFGVEAVGEADPGLDVEVIEMGRDWLDRGGVTGVSVELNSIGDATCRPAYREALREHFRPHIDAMGPVAQRRFELNPLRLLDSKDPAAEPVVSAAPSPVDFLCDACAEHYAAVKAGLDAVGVEYRENPRLVRGLDYYTRTAFEYWAEDLQGAQNALGGGGRYDGLAEVLGHPPTPAVGFAMGVDRAVLALERAGATVPAPPPQVYVIPAVVAARTRALDLAGALRRVGLRTVVGFGERSLKSHMRSAQKSGAPCVVIIGAQELAQGTAAVRDMVKGEQTEVNIELAVVAAAVVVERARLGS
jgi:histidyl-tRNA synthetase